MELGHTYYIGSSGSGKTTMMHHHIIAAIKDGHGVFYLDPHGPDIDTIMSFIPRSRRKDVILFDPSQFIVPFNPLADVKDIDTDAEAILYALKDIWRFTNLSTATFDEYVLHSLVTLMHSRQPTLLGVGQLLTSAKYRTAITADLDDSHLTNFWSVFDTMTEKEKRDERRSTVNKFNTMMLDLRLRRTLGPLQSAFTMDEVVDGRIFLARLPQGVLGIQKTRLLGMLLLCQLHLAALRRTTTDPFFVYIDEMHHFQGASLMEMLTGTRKYGINVHLAHQYLRQLSPEMRDAAIGNAVHRYIFRVGRADAALLKEDAEPNNTDPEYFELRRFEYRYGRYTEEVPPLPESPYVDAYHKTFKAAKEQFARNTADIDIELDRLFDST